MRPDLNEQRDNCSAGGDRYEAICSPDISLSFLMDGPVLSPNGWLLLQNTNASPQMPVMLTISGDDDPSSLSLVERFNQYGETSPMSAHKRKRQEKETLFEEQPTEMQNNNPEGQATVETIVRNNIPISATVEQFYPCGETSTMPGHKRKRQEKETLFEEQPTEMQNNNPEGQATVEAIVGNNIPISVTRGELLIHHAVDHPTHVVAQPSLEPISTQTSNSVSSLEGAKLIYNDLIALPLKVLINPENEAYMKNALYTLANNHSLFSEEQAEQILELYVEFPALVHKWREYSQFPMYSQMSSVQTEKIRDLVKNSERDEEILKGRYEELENEEKELMRQLEAVQKEKAETAEQRIKKYKEENLKKLADQWAELQSFFV